jgi:hypothetical protein
LGKLIRVPFKGTITIGRVEAVYRKVLDVRVNSNRVQPIPFDDTTEYTVIDEAPQVRA